MDNINSHERHAADSGGPISHEPDAELAPAWEMIENGRYQPRRIKGSLLGRELG